MANLKTFFFLETHQALLTWEVWPICSRLLVLWMGRETSRSSTSRRFLLPRFIGETATSLLGAFATVKLVSCRAWRTALGRSNFGEATTLTIACESATLVSDAEFWTPSIFSNFPVSLLLATVAARRLPLLPSALTTGELVRQTAGLCGVDRQAVAMCYHARSLFLPFLFLFLSFFLLL